MNNVSTRARFVANIFDVIAWVVLGVGALVAGIAFFSGLVGVFGDEWVNSFVIGVVTALVIGVYTAVSWACVSLASIVAGYIQNKS